jgi:arylsulfatase A-like enzyme
MDAPLDPPPEPRAAAPAARDATPLLTWLPAGLWAATALAAARLAVRLATERDIAGPLWPGQDGALATQALAVTASGLPLVLEHALVVGLLSAAVLSRAAGTLGSLLLTAALALTSISGWPLEPVHLQTALGGSGMASIWARAALAIVLALCLARALALARAGAARPGRALAGPLPCAVAAAFLFGGAFLWHAQATSDPPTLVYGETVVELLHDTDARSILTERADAPVKPTVITPNVWNHTDSADKPALSLTPPARVRLTVPADALEGDGTLRFLTAAGVDKTVRNRMPAGTNRVTIDFSIRVNGILRFRRSIVSTRNQPPQECVWHHATEDGEPGLRVSPGDEIVLETSFADGDDDGTRLAGEYLLAGFSDLLLEREVVRPRLCAGVPRPNVVLIVMDTLRADRLSCYGYERPTTPHIDSLAARGTLYLDALVTASWTWPSTASILTGLPADSHGVVSNESCTLTRGLQTLAEVLRNAGYSTGAFSGNPLIAPERLFDQGFADFDAHRSEFRKSVEILPDALEWIRRHRLDRFFLYLHLVDPHTPHEPLAEEMARLSGGSAMEKPADFPERGLDVYAGRILRAGPGADPKAIVPAEHLAWMREAYDGSVASGDAAVGRVLELLAELGLTDETVIAFTSDHGEELLDHGLLAHGHSLYRELVRTPLVLAGPGVARGHRVTGTVSNRHLAPTLAYLASEELLALGEGVLLLGEDHPTPGRAVTQTLRGTWNGAKRQQLFGLLENDYSLQWRPETNETRLFAVPADPGEKRNLAAEEPERAAALVEELKALLHEQRRWRPAHTVGAGAATLDMMRGVGYLGEDE